MRKLALFLAVQIVVAGGLAAPALAHGGGGPDATNFRSRVLGIAAAGGETGESPAGVTARILANDALIEMASEQEEIVVEGYSSEPYLRIGPDGVFRNRNSPATYVNQDRFGTSEAPSGLNASDPPDWEKVGDEPTYAWHDHRIHWMSQVTPTQVTQDSASQVVDIFEWTVPFSAGERRFEVQGELDWVRPDPPIGWLLLGLAFTSLPVAAGLLKPAGEERKRAWKKGFAAMLATLVVIDVVHSVDDVLAVPATLAENISASAQSALFLAIGAYGAVVAFRARAGAWVGILLGAFGLALGIGATHLVSLTSSQIASTLPEEFTRFVVAASAMSLLPAGLLAWRVHEPVIVESTPSQAAA